MKITKNFLPKDQYNFIKTELHSDVFPWYWNDYSVTPDSQPQFTHNFYDNYGKDVSKCFRRSDHLPLLEPIINILNPLLIFRIKINCNPQTSSIIETGMHQDLKDDRFLSSVLFLDTCDGYLRLKNNDSINSEDNKLVTFKSNIEHTGSTTTNKERRIVLSIIYLPTL